MSEVDIDSSDVSTSSSSDEDTKTLREEVKEKRKEDVMTPKPHPPLPPKITTFSPYELQRSRKIDYSAYPKVGNITYSSSLRPAIFIAVSYEYCVKHTFYGLEYTEKKNMKTLF